MTLVHCEGPGALGSGEEDDLRDEAEDERSEDRPDEAAPTAHARLVPPRTTAATDRRMKGSPATDDPELVRAAK